MPEPITESLSGIGRVSACLVEVHVQVETCTAGGGFFICYRSGQRMLGGGLVRLEVGSHQRFCHIRGLVHQRFCPIIGSDPLEVRELEVQSYQRFENQSFSPIIGSVPLQDQELEVQSHYSFGSQRFCPIIGSGIIGSSIRGSVPLQVRELEVRSHYRFGNQRFGPIRGSGIIDWGISNSVGESLEEGREGSRKGGRWGRGVRKNSKRQPEEWQGRGERAGHRRMVDGGMGIRRRGEQCSIYKQACYSIGQDNN